MCDQSTCIFVRFYVSTTTHGLTFEGVFRNLLLVPYQQMLCKLLNQVLLTPPDDPATLTEPSQVDASSLEPRARQL